MKKLINEKIVNRRALLLALPLILLLLTACGTFQVEVATSPEPTISTGGFITPTPSFDKPQFATEAGVMFDDRINLVGFTVEPETAGPGSSLTVTLIWQVMDEILAKYNTFIHIVNEEGQLLAQSDAPTGGGLRPSTDWIINEYIYDQHHLILPGDITSNDVEIRVGLYDADEGQRLDINDPNSFTISSIATPAADGPAPTEVVPMVTETPLIEDGDSGPIQDSLLVRVAYVKDANVWIWDAGSGSEQLTTNGGVENVWLSDDGQRIAFRRGQDLWVVDSDGGNERQLTRAADFVGLSQGQELDPFVTGIIPYQVAWLSGSRQLFFNTSPQIDGPGLLMSDDLWMVDTDSSELTIVLGPGDGGNFTFSPDGQRLAIVTPGRIDLMDVNGNNRREAFTHTPVITFSEFEYYAQPVWAADSGSLRVAIPPTDSSVPSAQPTSIWSIPVEDRPAWLIGQVTTQPRSHELLFAPNLARLAYLVGERPEGPDSDRPSMAIAEMSESIIWDPILFPADVMSVHGWSPDSAHLLYASETASIAEITMGQPDVRPLISGDDQGLILNVTWTDNFRFLYQQQSATGWDILLGRIDGSDPMLVDSVIGVPAAYDFAWVPAETAGQ